MSQSTRVIFLDFDGVLTLELERPGVDGATAYKFSGLDPEKILLLNEVIARTGACVVVSSSWKRGRTASQLQGVLEHHGFRGAVIGTTPDLPGEAERPGSMRGHEIATWLDAHPEVTAFVMLDDGRHTSGLARIEERLVQTTSAGGLEREHVERIVVLLGGLDERSSR